MKVDFLTLAKERSSVRKYEPKPIEDEKLSAILEAGRVAPTAANKQPCVFLILKSDNALAKLSRACTPHGAPLAIVVLADRNIAWVRPFDGESMVQVDSTIAADHIIMCAQDLGLSSCWITYFDPAVLRKEFNIPENLIPVNILTIGYSAETPQSPERHSKTRKPLDTMIKYETF